MIILNHQNTFKMLGIQRSCPLKKMNYRRKFRATTNFQHSPTGQAHEMFDSLPRPLCFSLKPLQNQRPQSLSL